MKDKIILFGELMLRLKSVGKERLFQSPFFEAVFGGSEANVAVSLSILGKKSVFVTALPGNETGAAAKASLNRFSVEVNAVLREGRLGIYYLEQGACQRPSKVIYDRENSCLSLAKPEEYNWKEIFSNAQWFHVSGVTPALTQNTADCVNTAMDIAKQAGIKISLDLNYRKKLWKYGKQASQIMRQLAQKADILVANEEDIQNCLAIETEKNENQIEYYKTLCKKVKEDFPNAEIVAVTLRNSYSADFNGWTAIMSGKNGFYQAEEYKIENIVERVGAGDAFAAGLIYGLTEFTDEKKALDFATAASCLKHSITGDFNLAEKSEIEALMNGSANGRIQR